MTQAEGDIMDPIRFGIQDEAAAQSFARASREDAEVACGQMFDQLGARFRLLKRKVGAPG